jgi:hypothetical protein
MNIESAQLLTPAECEELEGCAQLEVISYCGVNLEGVELTGFEMRQISLLSRSVRNEIDEVSIYMEDEHSAEEEEWRKSQFQERVADLLGKRRLADLARAQDEHFRDLWSFAHQNKISRPSTIKVYEVHQSAEAQVGQIIADSAARNSGRPLFWRREPRRNGLRVCSVRFMNATPPLLQMAGGTGRRIRRGAPLQ